MRTFIGHIADIRHNRRLTFGFRVTFVEARWACPEPYCTTSDANETAKNRQGSFSSLDTRDDQINNNK